MASESEKCVDELLVKLSTIEVLMPKLSNSSYKEDEALYVEARELLTTTQTFIDNNRTIIPSYFLKKLDDSLRNLNSRLNATNRVNLSFKFTGIPQLNKPDKLDKHVLSGPWEDDEGDLHMKSSSALEIKDKSDERLIIGSTSHINYNISNLKNCHVEIHSQIKAIYIEDLEDCFVACFSRGSIVVRRCSGCIFEVACQQLRIESSSKCTFGSHVAAGTVLESSKKIKFKWLELDKCEVEAKMIYECDFEDLKVPNNWKNITDFDCPSGDSRNYEIIDEHILPR